jgi:2-phosphosulfolactate phosphatase
MAASLEVLFAPAEFAALRERDLTRTICVVFDIFRASSTIITALAHDAAAVIPVAEIPEALELRKRNPKVLLAGEREGLRIHARLTGGINFDLGNSPREFIGPGIKDKTIVISTTNGSRALRACAGAKEILVGSFLNLHATAAYLARQTDPQFLLVCSGTGNEAAYEDLLGAGGLVSLLEPQFADVNVTDSANVARQIYQQFPEDLAATGGYSRNGRRLLANPDLQDDVAWCLQRDIYPLVAKMENGTITLK